MISNSKLTSDSELILEKTKHQIRGHLWGTVMVGMYFMMVVKIVDKWINKFNLCGLLEFLTTTSAFGWLTSARLRKLYGSVYINLKLSKFFVNYKCLLI